MNATIEFLTTIAALVGSVGGALVAEALGLRAAMALGLLGGVAAVGFLWLSPVRSMRAMPGGAAASSVAPTLTPEELPLTE